MKKSYASRLTSQIVTLAKKQALKKMGLIAGMFFVFGLAAFGQTNYYVITDSVAAGKAVKPNLVKAKFWSTNGSVTGQRPNDFITDGQIFNIQVPGLSNTKDWAVYGIGSKIVVGTDTTTAGYTFTSTNPSNIDGVIDVKPNSTFIYQGLNTDSLTWGTLSTGSTVNFTGNQNGFQKVPAGNYYNLSLKSGGGAYYPVVLLNGATYGVAGTFTPRGGQVYGSTIVFNGNGGQVIPSGQYYNLTITGSKTVSDTLKSTNTAPIYVAGAFTNNSTGAQLLTYNLNKSTNTLTSYSTVNFNGYIPQTLSNQAFYNLGFTNGQNSYVSSFNYSAKTVTLQSANPELQVNSKITAATVNFGLDTTTIITAVNDSIVTLSNAPTLKLFVSKVGGAKDTAFITSWNVVLKVDSAITLTSTPTFNVGDTVSSAIIAAPTYSKTAPFAATTAAVVSSISGNTIYLTQISQKGLTLSNQVNNLGAISFGNANGLPSAKTLSGLITLINNFTPGTGTINTTGSYVEYIGKKQNVAGITYDNLIINQDSATTATLQGKALVKSGFKLQSGKLTTNNLTNKLTLDVNATFPTVTNDTFFVNGPLAKNFASTTPFTYQIGAVVAGVGYGRTVTITPKTADPKTYSVSYTVGNSGYPANVKSTIGTLDTLSYYNVVLSNHSAGVDTSAQLTFKFVPDAYTLDSTITLAHFYHSYYYADAAAQTVTSATTPLYFTTSDYDTLFGHYAFGTVGKTIPVKFGAVSAAALANKTVKVSWESFTETNVSKYVIEGSSNGLNFTDKGSLLAKGASGYSFLDLAPKDGINYYRIKEVDNNGKFTYSAVVSVKVAATIKGGMSVYPNPVINKQLNFVLSTDAAAYTLKVTNILGQPVLASTINHNGGTTSYSVALPSALQKGIYFVKLTDGKNEMTKTVIVE